MVGKQVDAMALYKAFPTPKPDYKLDALLEEDLPAGKLPYGRPRSLNVDYEGDMFYGSIPSTIEDTVYLNRRDWARVKRMLDARKRLTKRGFKQVIVGRPEQINGVLHDVKWTLNPMTVQEFTNLALRVVKRRYPE